ncbi:restriction endonuclease subunit S [Campylobacter upsaliensis]|nr:restriction endonuclease subunit S [Campylobacter upsaliensis]
MKALNNNAHPLESLLKQHCPNGVEFKELGEVCETLPKGTLKTSQLTANGYPVINSGRDLYGYYSKFNNESNAFTIAARGEYAGFVNFMDSKFWAGGLCYPYRSNDENKLLTKFIYYHLKTNESNIMDSLVARGSIPAINKKDIDKKLKIPIPPLEIQQKIVDILDAFTELQAELQAELEAELEARLKQYHYYRNKLLSHDELENRTAKSRNDSDPTPIVPYVRLGEVCEKVFAGGDLPKEYSKDKKPSGEFLYPIYSNGSDENSLYGFSKTYRIDAEAVTISARGTIGFHTTREAKFTPIVRLITLIPNLNKITNRFLNYALYTTHIEKYGTSAGIPQLTIPMLEKITIPLPPLEVQNEIVELLDKFDTLANDLSAGLPAEIEARKKQYEYYRERLLSFIAKD